MESRKGAARTAWVPRAPVRLSAARRRAAWLLVFVGIPAFTVTMLPVRGTSALGLVLMGYVLWVVIVSVVGGIAPGLVGAVVSFLMANFFLTEPYHTFQVEVFGRLIELTVFVVVAALVSVTVDVGARHRSAAEHNRLEAATQAAKVRELAETDRVRSAILAAVSHDLRTPLAGIKAAVSSLRQRDVQWTPDEQEELLATIEDSSDRLNGVVTNLLAMSRIQAGALSLRMQPIVVDEVVASALLSLGTGADTISIDVPESLPTVTADPDLLERVIANLVMNAARVDPHRTTVQASTTDQRVRVAVVDHGPGVPPEQWEEMFLPFHRLDDREAQARSGLGLAIARGLCDAMGVSLSPSETPGGGLTMTVELEPA